jgi:sugar phosphate isomerase/epimerase
MKAAHTSRRQFLVRTTEALSAVAVTGSLACAAQPKKAASAKSKGSDIRFGFTTYTWGKPWDIPTIIANCTKAKALGVELRTSQNYAHGMELTTDAQRRKEVKKLFGDSAVTLVGLATSERFDSPDAAKLKQAIENAKAYLKLSHDIGGTGIRVFPNDFHKEESKEKTIARIAAAMNELGPVAGGLGQQIRLENHGSAGEMVNLKLIMDQVTDPNVRVKLNCDKRDMAGDGLAHNFGLLADKLGGTIHAHDFKGTDFDYQLQMNLLVKAKYRGWMLIENSSNVDDKVAALIEQREVFEKMLANAIRQA